MTPRTRKSNQEADFKVYYSKKIPKQVHFPRREKTVRRPAPERNGSEGRQLKLLPEKMKAGKSGTVMDSEDEDEDEDEGDEEIVEQSEEEDTSMGANQDGERHSDIEHDISDKEEELVRSATKRKRNDANPRRKRSSNAAGGAGGVEPSRKLVRRQSTMTQLADGRLPDSDAEELDFKPVKRRSRTSLGGKGEKEKSRRQQTLTQMIPGMVLLADEEMEDLERLQAQEEDDPAGGQTTLQRSSPSNVLTAGTDNDEEQMDVQGHSNSVPLIQEGIEEVDNPPHADQTSPLPIRTIEHETADEEEYHPTQFIDAPARKVRRASRRQSKKVNSVQVAEETEPVEPVKKRRTRFSLLSTPEKRRVFEIASSQSPAESSLSTQTSPEKMNRYLPMPQQQIGDANLVPETPSKRKRVTFQAVQKSPVLPPPTLKRFNSTILDSEDEGSDLEGNVSDSPHSTHSIGNYRQGKSVGDHTQAVLNQIDQACANADEQEAWGTRHSSEELGEPPAYSGFHEVSPELGDSWAPVLYDDASPGFDTYPSTHSNNSGLSSANDPASIEAESQDSQLADDSHEELPSTPMVLRDDSSDEELELTTPQTSRRNGPSTASANTHKPTNLDDKPIQVPRSPSAPHQIQQSHSSKAEQQIQTEWLSFSQYPQPPQTSSMLAHGTYSYNQTPRPPQSVPQDLPEDLPRHLSSQATTVDEVTPRRNRHHNVLSANTTPHRMAKSQPFISPNKPPSLFIPSSFPSPSATRIEDWSSPLLRPTQLNYGSSQIIGSIEDFSIPPPPPVEHD